MCGWRVSTDGTTQTASTMAPPTTSTRPATASRRRHLGGTGRNNLATTLTTWCRSETEGPWEMFNAPLDRTLVSGRSPRRGELLLTATSRSALGGQGRHHRRWVARCTTALHALGTCGAGVGDGYVCEEVRPCSRNTKAPGRRHRSGRPASSSAPTNTASGIFALRAALGYLGRPPAGRR